LNKIVEQGISDIVGCLSDPIIVFPGGWTPFINPLRNFLAEGDLVRFYTCDSTSGAPFIKRD